MLYFALAFGLVALGLSQWLAFLIVGAALLVLAAVVGLIGFSMVKKVEPPRRTIAQATETIAQVKAATQQALAAVKSKAPTKAIRR